MKLGLRWSALVGTALGTLTLQATIAAGSGDTTGAKPTFSKDVAPIFYKNCVTCHRPDGMAPMSLITYKDARAWARSIRENIAERKMPPWHADPHFGEFRNDRRLSKQDIDTIVTWVDGGSLQGDEKDLPPLLPRDNTWRIGKPDVVLDMPEEFTLGADGPDEYQYFVIPTNFKEDRWLQAAEALPGNSKVVHHIIAFIQPPQQKAKPEPNLEVRNTTAPQIIFYKDNTLIRVKPDAPTFDRGCETPEGGQGILADGTLRDEMPSLLCGEAPGRDADAWPVGFAKKLPAGASILLQVHYSRNGAVEKDRSKIGLIFAKQVPQKEVITIPIQNHYFKIPAGADNHEATACYTFREDVHLTSLMPHMHVRGKDMTIKAVFPDGRSLTLLSVPNYSFNWQTNYYLKAPIAIPKGTRFEVVAHFDNSSKNSHNPDPKKEVRWGDPTYDEMLIGWVDYTRDQSQSGMTRGH